MQGSLLDITQNINISDVEIREQFSYCIGVENISAYTIFDLIYTEKFNENIRIISIKIDGEEVKFSIDEKNVLSVFFDKMHLNKKRTIYVTAEVLDYVEKNDFNKLGFIIGKININNAVQEISEYINSMEINIINPKVVLTRISNLYEVIQGDIIEVVILAENMGNIDIENVCIRDILKGELEFINGSVESNDFQCNNENIIKGINIGTLVAGELKSIKYKVKVLLGQEKKVVINKAVGRFVYKDRDGEFSKRGMTISNIEKILIQTDNVDMKIEVQGDSISLNSEIEYRITIENIGTLKLYNLILKKDKSEAFLLMEESLILNNVLINQKNFEGGIFLGDLSVHSKFELKFKLKFVGGIDKSFVENIFILEKDYKLKDKYLFKGNSVIKKIRHSTNIASFKSIILEGEMILNEFNQPIKEINKLNCEIEILNNYLIETTKGKSIDNQIETGKKIIINGKIKNDIEYTILGDKGEVHFVNNVERFSSYIVVPGYITTKYKIIINGRIEEAYYKILTNKKVRTIVSIILIAQILSE
ncbi:MAG: hypothetical protein ACRDAU_11725 [Clostridium sp.]